jgi:5,5'-dehydrodivanillate O-demethylase
MENSVDPVHVEWLHRHFYNYVMARLGRDESCVPVRHEKIGFDLFEYGIIKRRVLQGDTEQDENWKVGHPLLFPNILVSGSSRTTVFQIRVPMDDTHTLHIWYSCYFSQLAAEKVPPEKIPFYQVPVPHLDRAGQPQWPLVDNNGGQDAAMWITQGETADRSLEHLGESDHGVILYRKLLNQELEKVESGEDPICVFRDPDNNASIKLHLEENKMRRSLRAPRAGNASRYSPLLNELQSKGVDVKGILVGSRED